MRGEVQRFRPAMAAATRRARLAGWEKAIAAVLSA
jgi:hypothetical protein